MSTRRLPRSRPAWSSRAGSLHGLHARHPGRTIVVVTHAELIRYAVLAARKLPLERWPDVEVPPASVTILTCDAADVHEWRGMFAG
ncbi:MAG TPA: histidine phosphatase family protein [Vicinamibacterales bacterium]|nr:histidine phosphatase family protein [Vicinamibacterales bacterium]